MRFNLGLIIKNNQKKINRLGYMLSLHFDNY